MLLKNIHHDGPEKASNSNHKPRHPKRKSHNTLDTSALSHPGVVQYSDHEPTCQIIRTCNDREKGPPFVAAPIFEL